MARHTKLSDKDVSAIAALYGLEVCSWRPIEAGDENTTFLLETEQGDCVLTFYEYKSKASTERNMRVLNYLADNGYYTNRVVPAEDGSLVSNYRTKHLVLKTWIPGEPLRAVPQVDYRPIGRAIAELHKIPAPEYLPYEHPYGLAGMPAALNHGADQDYETWLKEKIGYLENSFPAHLPKSFIHGDLFDDNIIYDEGKFQAIIDFGDNCYYTRAYDLGSVLFGACMQDGVLNLEQSRQILKGYQEIILLSPEEIRAVPFLAVYAGAAISAWHYLNTFVQQPSSTKKDKYKIAAQRTEHIFRLPQTAFDAILGNRFQFSCFHSSPLQHNH